MNLERALDYITRAELEVQFVGQELVKMQEELKRLRTRVGWLDHLDTEEGRKAHADEAFRVKYEEMLHLLRNCQPHFILDTDAKGAWYDRYDALMREHKETP